jgi:hypothetical protein
MKIVRILGWSVAVLAVLAGGIAAWVFIPWPAPPIESRISSDYDLTKWDGSMPPDTGEVAIMIVGSTHLAQNEPYPDQALNRFAEGIADYQPDLVAVEYLPPEYPVGAGRDYRPDFDLEALADAWSMDREHARTLIREAEAGESVPTCNLAKAYLLNRDYMNALYHWRPGECPELAEQDSVKEWAEGQRSDEASRFGFHAARQSGLDGVFSFDYQGADARWFIHGELQAAMEDKDLSAFLALWPMLPKVGAIPRAFEAHTRPHKDDIIDYLNYYNSPEHIGLQYWVYEEAMQAIDYQDTGSRQTENYWRRNERMFDYLKEATEDQDAERVLVVVGGGHKYFLDELAREAGYRWIDPREYLPSPQDES